MHGARQLEARRVALERATLHLRPAGIGQAQHLGDLVEGFADRVVHRRADALVIVHAAHGDELRVPARDEQQQIGKIEIVREPRRERVGFEMVHGDEGLARHQRQRLAGREPDHHPADEPRPRRRGDAVEVGQLHPRLVEGAAHDVIEPLEMGARRDFGNDAAERRVFLDLAVDLVRQDLAAPARPQGHDRGRGFVAGGLNSQNAHRRVVVFLTWARNPIVPPPSTEGRPGGKMAAAYWLRIGTRGSPLALAQTRETRRLLAKAHGADEDSIEIVVIRTTGDMIQDRALSQAGGKGLFTKELDAAMLEGRIDIAVHSSKDLPTLMPDGIVVAGFLPARGRARRADRRRAALHRRPAEGRERRHRVPAPAARRSSACART